MAEAKSGKVYIIGAGPGDPGLLTVRGREALRQADAVVYDASVNSVLLREAGPKAELICGGEDFNQSVLLVSLGRAGKTVARLVTGDGLAFASGSTEAEALAAANVPFEIVPGVTSAIAAPAYAGISVTYRDVVSAFTVVNIPADLNKLDWSALAAIGGTLVFQLNKGSLGQLAKRLIEAGKSANTPVALVSRGTTWQQRTVSGTLASIPHLVQEAEIETEASATLIVGEVARLREQLQWWDTPAARPLLGKRIVVTRAREQAGSMLNKLIELGADAIEFSTIQIIEPESYAPMDEAIGRLSSYDWVVFTSVNGVDHFMRRLKQAGKDARAFGQAKICAIGPATAAALEAANLKADFMPSKYVAESILEDLGDVSGQKFLLARADVAREALYDGLLAQGAQVDQVTAYRQIISDETDSTGVSAAQLAQWLDAGEIDLVTFTSSNTVRNFVTRLKSATSQSPIELLEKTMVACIGPITAGTARELGLRVDLEAAEFTIDKLIEVVISRQLSVVS